MERLLLVTRYSGEDDAGALARQDALLAAFAAEHGGPVVDKVEDETVSGSINLDERKKLGKWMREPLLSKWDKMVVTEQDRVTRDDMHWWQFVGNLIRWGKYLVVLDDPALDLSTPNGRMIAGIKATQAANYRLDVKKKILKAREDYREQKRYVGGHWPFGRRVEPREDGGWQYVTDETTAALVREASDRILADQSLREIVRDWHARGVPTARDYQALTTPKQPGKPKRKPRGYEWDITALRRILNSPTVLGYATHYKEVIRKDGIPVQWMDPLMPSSKFLAVQKKLEEKGAFRKGIRSNRSPFLGVLFCPNDHPMHYVTNQGYNYYRCGTIGGKVWTACPHNKNWPISMVKDYLEDRFMDELGDKEIQTKTFVPGQNHDEEISTLKEAIEFLTGNLASLKPDSRAASSIIQKINEHEERLDALEAAPAVPSEYVYKGLGETFRQRWDSLDDWAERGAWLMRMGVRARLGGVPKNPDFEFIVPADISDRAQVTAPVLP